MEFPKEIFTNVHLDQFGILAPVIAATLLNTMYTAELLRVQKGLGESSSLEISEATKKEVTNTWTSLTTAMMKMGEGMAKEKQQKK